MRVWRKGITHVKKNLLNLLFENENTIRTASFSKHDSFKKNDRRPVLRTSKSDTEGAIFCCLHAHF